MPKPGLPDKVKMRHDLHYVEEFVNAHRSIGKILPIDKIRPNPQQPRSEIGDLSELTESVREKGVLEPLLVRPNRDGTWMIIAGERRWRAANAAGLIELPCVELNVDDGSLAEIALIENMQRKDLTVWEEADGLADLKSRFSYNNEQIAKKIGKSRTTVTEALTLANLPSEVREKCAAVKINSKSTLLEIARQFDEAAMFEFIEKLENSVSMSRSEVRRLARPDKAVRNEIAARDQNNRTGDAKTAVRQNKISNSAENVFRYSSDEEKFEIEISFSESVFNKKDILRALKEAFDSVKARD